jgi:hypothetical protein
VHSHNYNLGQSWKRHFGEGKAEAWIFRRGEISGSFFRYCFGPMVMEILRDLRWALRSGSLDAAVHAAPLRFVQKLARWRGFREGRRAYGT